MVFGVVNTPLLNLMIFLLKDVPGSVGEFLFYYNENDAYFNYGYYTFGQFTGKYESTDIYGHKFFRYLSNGQLHRDGDEPADICYYADYSNPQKLKIPGNGNKLYETWYVNGQYHRDGDSPAQIYYHENGNKQSETWYVNGLRHRDGDSPADIEYYADYSNPQKLKIPGNGNKKIEQWYVNDKCHRDNDLPAEICYYENGEQKI